MKKFPRIPGRDLPLWYWGFGYLDFLLHTAGPGLLPLGSLSLLGLLAALAVSCAQNRGRWARDLDELRVEFRRGFGESPVVTASYALCFVFLFASLLLGLFSAARPPHLPQEYDAINYQMGTPHLLLVRHSLAWIDWACTDLWPMAMQWGMAPLSAAFSTINKLPQFLFALGAAACLFRIPRQFDRNAGLSRLIPLFAVMGAHGIMVQIGTGMMDLPLLYLLLACLSALLDKRWYAAAVALSVFTASKTFNPFLAFAFYVPGLLWARSFAKPLLRKFTPAFFVLSALLLLRSTVLSFEATGTPLFPIGACKIAGGTLCEGPRAAATSASVADHMATRDGYGNGRGPRGFVLHLWRISVPTAGVNNEFDYPLGLPWLLLLVLIAYAAVSGGWRHPVLVAALLNWGLWWLNAHQARWLYPTLALGFLGTLDAQKRARHVLPALCALSFALTLVSQVRSVLPTANMSAAALEARERAKVKWGPGGALATDELLYVDRPAFEHVPTRSRWILE